MKTFKNGTLRLSDAEYSALVEALRRRSRFRHDCGSTGDGITQQWTGLGCEKHYHAVKISGLMEIATTPNPRYSTWWKLTEKGARIVVYWIANGFDHLKIEANEMPPQILPKAIL